MNAGPVDPATVGALASSLGADFVREVVEAFLADAPAMLRELRRSLVDGDAEAFRRTAHTLKSNAHTFGAAGLGARAKALELGGLAAARAPEGTLDELEREYRRVAVALQEIARG